MSFRPAADLAFVSPPEFRMKTARLYRVEGRVQGVGFRFFVERAALELGLKGYVCNCPEGSVEVYAVGSEEILERLRAELERGPLAARVERVVESPAALRSYDTFSIVGGG
jgi:acylphosphatase